MASKQKEKEKEKEEEEKKRFKAKTRKGVLNHIKKKGQVENLKRRLDQGKRFLD